MCSKLIARSDEELCQKTLSILKPQEALWRKKIGIMSNAMRDKET